MKFTREQIQAQVEAMREGTLTPSKSPVWNQWIEYPNNDGWMCDQTTEQIINDFQYNGDLVIT
jgi:hypothetical protein